MQVRKKELHLPQKALPGCQGVATRFLDRETLGSFSCSLSLFNLKLPVPRRAMSQRHGGMLGAPSRLVLWFRNDLRLCDNYIVSQAAQKLVENRKLQVKREGEREEVVYSKQIRKIKPARHLRTVNLHSPHTRTTPWQILCTHDILADSCSKQQIR